MGRIARFAYPYYHNAMSIEYPRGEVHREEEAPAQQKLEELPLDALQALYRKSKEQVALLEENLNKGIEHTIDAKDAAVRHVGTEVGRDVARELEEWRAKKEAAEQILKDHGLTPDDFA